MGNLLSININVSQLISILIGASIFLAVIFIGVIRDERQSQNSRKPHGPNEWLFTRWDEKIYDAFVHERPEVVLTKLGVDVEQYLKDCSVCKEFHPNLKRVAARKLIGMAAMLFGLFAAAFVKAFIVAVLVVLFGWYLYDAGIKKMSRDAKVRKQKLANELPRFLDLLQTALYINLPVDDAITVTCKHLKGTMIADELLASMAETQIGAISWQDALGEVARKYDVDTFSDFVLYLVTGYEKGLSIYEVVRRQAVDVQKSVLVRAEENASKLNSSILIPIAIYKLVPVIVLAALPIVAQLSLGQLF